MYRAQGANEWLDLRDIDEVAKLDECMGKMAKIQKPTNTWAAIDRLQ
jgi:hypothetical protein